MAERDVASTAARNRGHETPGAAAGQDRLAAWSLRTGAGGNAGDDGNGGGGGGAAGRIAIRSQNPLSGLFASSPLADIATY